MWSDLVEVIETMESFQHNNANKYKYYGALNGSFEQSCQHHTDHFCKGMDARIVNVRTRSLIVQNIRYTPKRQNTYGIYAVENPKKEQKYQPQQRRMVISSINVAFRHLPHGTYAMTL